MEKIFQYFNLSAGLGFSVGIALASIAIIMFGEILPKNLARGRSEKIFRSMLWLINGIYYLLYPLVSILMRFSDAIMYRVGPREWIESSTEWVSSEREVRFLIEYMHDKGIMEAEKTEMLRNIFDLGQTPVRDIMIPETDIVSVNVETPVSQVLETFSQSQFTRLPVYKDTTDNIIGIIHQKDVFVMLSRDEDKKLEELIRPIIYIPESLKINQLLRKFRKEQMHIAMVLNEHGSLTGLITLEDVLEEIVGEISDEHKPTSKKLSTLPQGGYICDASITLDELSEELDMSFETEDSITLGGFLTERLQHVPKKGDRIFYKKYYFMVQKASPKRVLQVLIIEEKKKEKGK